MNLMLILMPDPESIRAMIEAGLKAAPSHDYAPEVVAGESWA